MGNIALILKSVGMGIYVTSKAAPFTVKKQYEPVKFVPAKLKSNHSASKNK